MSFWCTHSEGLEVNGEFICSKCGATYETRLTRESLERSFEAVRRDGYHSMKCVQDGETKEWCCADNCPSRCV